MGCPIDLFPERVGLPQMGLGETIFWRGVSHATQGGTTQDENQLILPVKEVRGVFLYRLERPFVTDTHLRLLPLSPVPGDFHERLI